jgi:hypothetical protein
MSNIIHRLVKVLIVVILAKPLVLAQPVSVVVKGGVTWYGASAGIPIGSSETRGDHGWKPGPILGIGARLQASKRVSLELDADVSTFQHKMSGPLYDPINDPRNTIWDLSLVSRFYVVGDRALDACLLLGLGVGYQIKDDFIPAMPMYPGSIGVGRKGVDMTALVGLAVEQPISERLSFALEASLRFRTYGSSVLALSTIYAI